MLEIPESWDACQEELLTGSGTNLRERNVLQTTKLKIVGDLKSTLTTDVEMQRVEFAQLVSALLWSSISSLCSLLPFGKVM